LGWRSLPGVLLFSLHDHLGIIAIRSDLYANPSMAIFLANESTNADPKIHLSTENMSFRKRIYHTMRPNTHATRSPQGSQNAIIIVTMYRFLGSFRDKWVSNPSTEWRSVRTAQNSRIHFCRRGHSSVSWYCIENPTFQGQK